MNTTAAKYSSSTSPLAALLWKVMIFIVFVLSVWGGQRLRTNSVRDASGTSAISQQEPAGNSTRGEMLYHLTCVKCHGPLGHGDGEGIQELAQRPRDFASDRWRYPKTRESIQQVIAQGIPGTSMPASHHALSSTDIALLADYVLKLAQNTSGTSTPTDLELAIEAAGFHPTPRRPAPPLRVLRTDGVELTREDLLGTHTLLHFWGTSCVHCLAEFSALQNLDQFDRLKIVSICIDEFDVEAVEAAGRRHAGQHQLFIDESGLLTQRFQVQSLPTFVLMNAQGEIIASRIGASEWSLPAMTELLDLLTTNAPSPQLSRIHETR